jgi:hypothetical protein
MRGPPYLVSLRLETSEPIPAGTRFRLRAELSHETEERLQVALEKQRILWNSGGFPELRPTGVYFDLDPAPFYIEAGQALGASTPIQVMSNPQGVEGDPPVHFPESLLFTAFDRGPRPGLVCCAVPIWKPRE